MSNRYQFETAFVKDYESYERLYDSELKKSIVRKIDLTSEWFEESPNGNYVSITDKNKRFNKHQGHGKKSWGKDGVFTPIERKIRDTYWGKNYNKNPRIFYLDIETRTGTVTSGFPKPEDALEPISLMQIYDNISNTMFIFGEREWKYEKLYEFDYDVKYYKCENELHIIEGFLKLFKALNPLIVYAWNGSGFDFPYIFNRFEKLGIDTAQLSNFGKVTLKQNSMGFKIVYDLRSDGHMFIDLLDVYKKFTFGLKSSYSLDNIAFEELGKQKVKHTEYEKFDDFYTGKYIHPKNPTDEQKSSRIFAASSKYIETQDERYLELVKELAHSEFVYYGAIDTYLIKEIDNKKNFTSLMIMLAEKMGVLISETLGTVRPWSQYISNIAYTNNEIIERPNNRFEGEIKVKGGRVTDPTVGLHKWVCSVDVNSMYPNTMRAFNMSPEKFTQIGNISQRSKLRDILLSYFNDEDEDRRLNVPEHVMNNLETSLKEEGYCLGINGALFKTDEEGMVPKVIGDFYNERKSAKKTQFKYEKQKLLIKDILKERK